MQSNNEQWSLLAAAVSDYRSDKPRKTEQTKTFVWVTNVHNQFQLDWYDRCKGSLGCRRMRMLKWMLLRQTWRRRRTAPPWCEVCQFGRSGWRKGTGRDSYQSKTPSPAHHSHHTPIAGKVGIRQRKSEEEEKQVGFQQVKQKSIRSRVSRIPLTPKHLQYGLLWVTCQQLSQSGVWEFLQRAGTEAPLQTSDVHVDETLVRVLVSPAGQTLLPHG